MRITLPTRIPVTWALAYIIAMFIALIVQNTHLLFAILFVVHSLLTLYAFNTAGGFSRIIGPYALFYSVLTVTFGITWKVILNQPADSNLGSPLLDMTLYTVSMALLCIVVHIVKAVDLRRGSLAVQLKVEDVNYSKVALGCLMAAFIIQFLDLAIGASSGSLLSILNQLNVFLPLAILMGTIGVIRNSNGHKSLDMVSGIALFGSLILGTLAFSKQGMIEPEICWLAGAAYTRFRLRTIHYIVFAAFLYFVLFFASPIAGLRNDVPLNGVYSDRITILVHALTHWDEVKRHEAETVAYSIEKSVGATYFGVPQGGLVERMTMLPVDESLFQFSANGHYVGYETILWDFENWIPHFILPSKHGGYTGNYYVHEMGGGLAEDDYTTGISFSPLAEAFHIDGWTSVFILLPTIWILLFFSFDLVVGDLKRSPWGLLIVVLMIHTAPESLLSNLIQAMGYGNLSVAFAMYFSAKLAPVLGSLLYGEKVRAEAPKIPMRAPQGLAT